MPGRATGRSRELGQHFLGSQRLATQLVADAGVERAHRVVDLGAGRGALTNALAATEASVLAVELDDELARGLAVRFAAAPNVTVLRADVCDVPLPLTPFRVVANPPFGHTAAVDAAMLVVTRRDPPLVDAEQFVSYAALVAAEFARRSDQRASVEEWATHFSAGRVDLSLHSPDASANMD